METQPGFLESFLKKTKAMLNEATGSESSPSYTSTTSTTPYTTSTTPYNPSFGGKNKGRKRSRKMRGGAYVDNIALTGYAATAAPISDIKSAHPLNIVGGKRRTKKCRRNRRAKSCKKRRR